jgi:steroid delta-isomerase-like uncharacterized protein
MTKSVTASESFMGMGIVILLGLSGSGCSGGQEDKTQSAMVQKTEFESALTETTMSGTEQNKAIARLCIETQGTAKHQEFRKASMSANYQQLRAEFQNLTFNAEDSELFEISSPIQAAFPDRKNVIRTVVADGDMVGVQYRISGTHAADFLGVPATGKSFAIDAAAIFKFADGKITQGWFMADEAAFLQQTGVRLPTRRDGRATAAPLVLEGRAGDIVIAELMARPIDSGAYRNKLMVNAYKSKNPPPGILPDKPGRPYEKAIRSGFFHLSERGAELGTADEFPMGGAFPDRLDKIALLLAEDDTVMIAFRLTATNTVSLFGIPPTNAPVDVWEVGFMTFEEDYWKYGWWFGDDLGMSLQLRAPPEFLLPESLTAN